MWKIAFGLIINFKQIFSNNLKNIEKLFFIKFQMHTSQNFKSHSPKLIKTFNAAFDLPLKSFFLNLSLKSLNNFIFKHTSLYGSTRMYFMLNNLHVIHFQCVRKMMVLKKKSYKRNSGKKSGKSLLKYLHMSCNCDRDEYHVYTSYI